MLRSEPIVAPSRFAVNLRAFGAHDAGFRA
jgi:hypothetical protein